MKYINKYQSFWHKNLSIQKDFFQNNTFTQTSSGTYLDKYKDFFFIFQDLNHGSICISANNEKLQLLNKTKEFEYKNLDAIKKSFIKNNYNLIYEDFDMYLNYQLIKPISPDKIYTLHKYNSSDKNLVIDFINTLNEEDKDILDLNDNFSELEIWYFKFNNQIVSIGTYFTFTQNNKITDITLVTKEDFKNKKLATNILFEILNDIVQKNLVPRYRVAIDNLPSIKIAEKLGLSKYNKILAFSQ